MMAFRLGALVFLSVVGCTSAGEKCVDGLVLDGGECIPRCNVSSCVAENRCVNNECKLLCETFLDCAPNTQSCVEATEDVYLDGGGGGTIKICVDNGHPAGIGAGCPVGDECEGELVCVTRGEGDGDAYCAEVGCIEDGDCSPGYQCGVTRDPRRICGTSKGDNDTCGLTGDPCVSRDDIAPPLSEGSVCLLRNTCIKPAPCSPCESDLDCTYGAALACVEFDGDNRCLARCVEGGSDCNPDSTCEDDVCKPRFGSCEGEGNFCEPCQDDRDCGDENSSNFCVEYSEDQFGCTTPCDAMVDCFCGAPPGLCLSPGDLISQCLNVGYCAGVNAGGLIGCWEPE